MSKKNQTRHQSNYRASAETAFVIVGGSGSKVPSQTRKEAAEPTLYIDRI
jgi:hypothetical protein